MKDSLVPIPAIVTGTSAIKVEHKTTATIKKTFIGKLSSKENKINGTTLRKHAIIVINMIQ